MKTINQFKTIREPQLKAFNEMVNKEIENGWQLYGNLQYWDYQFHIILVKFKKKEK